MTINLDGKFCWEEAPWLNWGDIKYGFDHQYINSVSVIQFAVAALSVYSPPLQYDLAMTDPKRDEEVERLLSDLSKEVKVDPDSSKKSWIFIFLKKLYIRRDEHKDPLRVIEQIYADFEYPEYVSPIVRYMPVTEGNVTGVDEIYRKWENLLCTLLKELSYDHCVF